VGVKPDIFRLLLQGLISASARSVQIEE